MSERSHRIFFALWPPDNVRQQLTEQTRPFLPESVRVTKASNLHLTLAFIGIVDSTALRRYRQVAKTIRFPAFKITLDQPGCFERAGVLWLGSSQNNRALQSFVSLLNTGLAAAGYLANDKPFVPHVTLARKYKSPEAVAMPVSINWWVRDFALVESCSGSEGVEYRVIHTWPLLTEKPSPHMAQSHRD